MDMQDIESGMGPDSMLPSLKELLAENHQLREVFGELSIRKSYESGS